MRNLQGKDVLTVAKIIKVANINSVINDIQKEMKSDEKAEQVGIKIIFNVLSACSDDQAGKLVFEWLDDVLEVKDSAHMDLFELVEMIKQLVKENNFQRFFSTLGQSM